MKRLKKLYVQAGAGVSFPKIAPIWADLFRIWTHPHLKTDNPMRLSAGARTDSIRKVMYPHLHLGSVETVGNDRAPKSHPYGLIQGPGTRSLPNLVRDFDKIAIWVPNVDG